MKRVICSVAIAAMAIALAACEDGHSSGDPGAHSLPTGKTCQSIRHELDQMDASGAQPKVERASHGKVDAATQAVADHYNELLNEYLGARCHV